MAYSHRQKYLAEFVGTMGLLLAVGGAAVFSLGTGFLAERVAIISLSVGFGLIGLIYAFGEISGAHLNPAVTVGAWVAGRFPGRDVVPYILAQAAGGVFGMGLIAAIAYGGGAGSFATVQSGALASQCYSTSSVSCFGYGVGAVFLIEVVFTFLLVTAILFATRPESPEKKFAPVAIGLTLLMTNLVAIPVDGASINPARSFAPAVLSAFWSSGNWAIGQDWLFWVAPIVGAVFAALLDRALRE
jgi:aquaporin Z